MSKQKSTFNSKAGVPPETDDLKLINGIGPVIESRLNKVGIFTFAQLAMLSPADIAEAVSSMIGLSAQQISAQDWIEQAHKLALQAAESKHQRTAVTAENLLEAVPVKDEPYKNVQTPTTPLHDAIFTVEFSLNSDSTVRATHVLHIQTRHEMTWEGWQDTALLDFFALYGRLNLLQNESPPPVTKEIDAAQETALPTDVKREPLYMLNLQKLEILPHGADHHRRILLSEQLFDARLTLDWDMKALTADPLDYTVSLFAKKLGVQGYRGCIGEVRGTVAPAKSAIIKVEGMTLPQGTYRLDAHLILKSATGSSEASPGPSILKTSQILHIN